MKRRGLVVAIAFALFLLLPAPLPAQAYPAVEGFAGFSLLNNEYGATRRNSPGLQLNFGYNPLRRVRLIADFSAQFHGSDIQFSNREVKVRDYRMLFGPEVVIRNRSRATPFAHVLAGYASRRFVWPTGEWNCTDISGDCSEIMRTLVSDSGFAMAVGGGVDVNLRPNYGIRLFQFDYMRAHLSRSNPDFVPDQGMLPTLKSWQTDYRISAGFYFRFGERTVR